MNKLSYDSISKYYTEKNMFMVGIAEISILFIVMKIYISEWYRKNNYISWKYYFGRLPKIYLM